MTDQHSSGPSSTRAAEPPAPASASTQDRYRALLAEAITALTKAARLTRTDTGPGARIDTRPVDWAEFVALAVTGAAANIGSRDQVLDGRPHSWEADTVRDLITRTVGDRPDQLLAHRTDPLPMHLDVDAILDSEEVQVDCGWSYEVAADMLTGRRGKPPADTEQVDDLLVQLDQLRRDEWTKYAEALEANVRAAAVDAGVRVPLDVTVTVNSATTRRAVENGPALPAAFPTPSDHRDLAAATADRLRRRAIAVTRLPDRDPLSRLTQQLNSQRTAAHPVPHRLSDVAPPPVPSPPRGLRR